MAKSLGQVITESVIGGAPFKVGDTVRHPDGRMVRIISGQWWGTYGLSNHWSWQEVLPNGKLSSKVEHGYGWSVKQ